LSTYGIGKEWTKKQWMHLARQLLQMGYLKQEGEFRTLALTARAVESLKKREPVLGVVQEAERVKKDGKKKDEVQYNSALFAILRQKRKALADEAGVPPYVIFSDRTLTEMAAYYPQSTESLLKISGVGQAKLEKYGALFLESIRTYCEKHGLSELPVPTRVGAASSERGLAERTRLVAGAFNNGDSVEALMARHQVAQSTILEHLTKYVLAGNKLRAGEDLQACIPATPEQQRLAFAAFAELSPTYFLKPVFDRLDGKLSYDDLRVLRLLFLISGRE